MNEKVEKNLTGSDPDSLADGIKLMVEVISWYPGYGAWVLIEGIKKPQFISHYRINKGMQATLTKGSLVPACVSLHIDFLAPDFHKKPLVTKLEGTVNAIHAKWIDILMDEETVLRHGLECLVIGAYRPALNSNFNYLVNMQSVQIGTLVTFVVGYYKSRPVAKELELISPPTSTTSLTVIPDADGVMLPDQAEIAAVMKAQFEEAVSLPNE